MNKETHGLLNVIHVGMILALIGAAVAAATEGEITLEVEQAPYEALR